MVGNSKWDEAGALSVGIAAALDHTASRRFASRGLGMGGLRWVCMARRCRIAAGQPARRKASRKAYVISGDDDWRVEFLHWRKASG
jgi:hypothetical protein